MQLALIETRRCDLFAPAAISTKPGTCRELECPFCGEPVEIDLLLQRDGGMAIDWMPCCLPMREAVATDGWDATLGRPLSDDVAASTGLRPSAVVNNLASFRLQVVDHGSTKGWRGEVFREVDEHHRHHWAPVASRFNLAVYNGMVRVGVAVVATPVSRVLAKAEPGTLEVTRVATWGALRRNACTKLYGAAVKEARRRGFTKLITYTLRDEEDGTSLRAAGFVAVAESAGGTWDRPGRTRTTRQGKAPNTGAKIRWERAL